MLMLSFCKDFPSCSILNVSTVRFLTTLQNTDPVRDSSFLGQNEIVEFQLFHHLIVAFDLGALLNLICLPEVPVRWMFLALFSLF